MTLVLGRLFDVISGWDVDARGTAQTKDEAGSYGKIGVEYVGPVAVESPRLLQDEVGYSVQWLATPRRRGAEVVAAQQAFDLRSDRCLGCFVVCPVHAEVGFDALH